MDFLFRVNQLQQLYDLAKIKSALRAITTTVDNEINN
jgi:hypothetical protein